jgi:hypothetical protein
LESSRGGNSHQSETNLIEKTPEANLPGARKGLVFSPKQQSTNATETASIQQLLIPTFAAEMYSARSDEEVEVIRLPTVKDRIQRAWD